MPEMTILQKGCIYFFYRPRIQHVTVRTLEDVQRFFMVLKPEESSSYSILVIGRKHMPLAEPYFAFVEKIAKNRKELISNLEEEHYKTATRGEREVPASRCAGEGKYLLIDHENHTHLCYQLLSSENTREYQSLFSLSSEGDYLISIKNPNAPSPPGAGLSPQQKPSYPGALKGKMADYRFIPLNPPSFLGFEGAEILLIGKKTSDLQEKAPEIKKHFSAISLEKSPKKLKH